MAIAVNRFDTPDKNRMLSTATVELKQFKIKGVVRFAEGWRVHVIVSFGAVQEQVIGS